MAENLEHVMDDLAAYVLESLEGPERRRIEAHVETCSTCAQRLDEYRAIVWALPTALTPVSPPSAAWTAIHAAARKRQPDARGWRTRVAFPDSFRFVKWPALATLIAGLLVWNVALEW